jgi:hypothetical protein
MRAVICVAALLLLGGCSTGTAERVVGPENTRIIEGTVTMNGRPVSVPMVASSLGTSVFGDRDGHYKMLVPLTPTVVTLYASDGHAPGQIYFATHSGSAEVPVGGWPVTVDIVLTSSAPI